MPDLQHQLNFDNLRNGDFLNDFMPPEQRLDAVAEILATIGLRALKKLGSDHSEETKPM